MLENGLGDNFSGGVEVFKPDDSFAVGLFEMWVLGVVGVHAECMIKLVQKVTDETFNDFEVADHLVCVEGVRNEYTFNLTRVPVRKTALVGML